MRNSTFILIITVIAAAAGIPTLTSVDRNTAQRISEHNYPADTHHVHTEDGYILTVYRIPYSRKLKNKHEHRPVVYLQHGVLSSSDCWILSGPDSALAYLLADAGYDVWLGNARGNTYSKKHKTLSTREPSFWDFSWHEIGLYDISASIDYILNTINKTGLHFVGHSMGTTELLVLMSLKPEYNAKVKTAHLLGPVAYTSHMTSQPTILFAPFLGLLTDVFLKLEFLPHNSLLALKASIACSDSSPLQPACISLLFYLFGSDTTHFNTTLLSDFFETHPAGTSTKVLLHSGQEYLSGYFRQYDYGSSKNLEIYNRETPPEYNVSEIVAPLWLYYCDNDPFVDATDFKKIESLLPNVVESFHVPYPDWNHIDYLVAREGKETIYERVINTTNHFEAQVHPEL